MSDTLPAGYMLRASNVVVTYNNGNRLVRIQADGVDVASYLVSGLGQRVQKNVGGAVTPFVHDEADGRHANGDFAAERRHGRGLLHSSRPSRHAACDHPSQRQRLHVALDNTEAFGNNLPSENPSGQGTFKYGLSFPGQYYDAEIGTSYDYFRGYDPTRGDLVFSTPGAYQFALVFREQSRGAAVASAPDDTAKLLMFSERSYIERHAPWSERFRYLQPAR